MCGNGIRCLGKFVADELGEERSVIEVLTGTATCPFNCIALPTALSRPSLSAWACRCLRLMMYVRHWQWQRPPHRWELLKVDRTQPRCHRAVSNGAPHAVGLSMRSAMSRCMAWGRRSSSTRRFLRRRTSSSSRCSRPHVCGCGSGSVAAARPGPGMGPAPAWKCREATACAARRRRDFVALNGGELTINWPMRTALCIVDDWSWRDGLLAGSVHAAAASTRRLAMPKSGTRLHVLTGRCVSPGTYSTPMSKAPNRIEAEAAP